MLCRKPLPALTRSTAALAPCFRRTASTTSSTARRCGSPTPASPTCSRCSPRLTARSFPRSWSSEHSPASPRAPKNTRWASAALPLARSFLTTARCRSRICLGEVGKGATIAFNILNIGRFKLGAMCLGRRARFDRAGGCLCQAAQGFRQVDQRVRPGPRKDRQHGHADLCRRVAGLSHGRHDGHVARRRSTRRAPMRRNRCARPSRSMRSSARS